MGSCSVSLLDGEKLEEETAGLGKVKVVRPCDSRLHLLVIE